MSDVDLNTRLKAMESDLAEIKTALKGAFGGPGLVAIVSDQNKRIARLEAERQIQRGVTIILSLVGSGIMTMALRSFLS